MLKLKPKPGDRILDVGVSNDTGIGSNMLEQLYPCRENPTCASLTDGKLILAAYPGVHHVQIKAGAQLPFDNNEFDIIYSNAVLEHAGSRVQQGKFIAEICRVARRRFFAVPDRGFPIEHHTCLPLIHWLPKSWFRALFRGPRYDFWSQEENLNCLSTSDIRALWPGDGHPTFGRSSNVRLRRNWDRPLEVEPRGLSNFNLRCVLVGGCPMSEPAPRRFLRAAFRN